MTYVNGSNSNVGTLVINCNPGGPAIANVRASMTVRRTSLFASVFLLPPLIFFCFFFFFLLFFEF